MFMRQPRSTPVSTSAFVSTARSAFWVTIAFEMSGYLIEKVPPKPQQTSLSFISTKVIPSKLFKSFRGWAATPISLKEEQESWKVTRCGKARPAKSTPSTSPRKAVSSVTRLEKADALACQEGSDSGSKRPG